MTFIQRISTGTIAILFLLGSGLQTFSDTPSQASLIYFDNEEGITVLDKDGFQYELINFGMELRAGDRIVTTSSSAEIQLLPDGSIIRLSENTDFGIDSIQGPETDSDFSLQSGRMRSITGRSASSRFNVRTRTAVGGVRGTDFVMEVIPDERDAVFVVRGAVEFQNIETGESVMVGSQQGANTFAENFTASEWSEEARSEILENMDFAAADPEAVPRADTEEEDEEGEEEEEEEEETTDESDGEETDGEETDEDEDTTEEPVDTAGPAQTQPVSPSPDPDSPPAPDDSDGLLDGALEFLGGYMNMEIGSITMGGETYGKVILQPEFELGKFGVGLYLPVIYRDNLFNPSTWYQPEGNNEWSFGTDADFSDEQDETLLRIQDFWNDVWLKIRYVRWGEQRDPFFITLGNINSMTLGHGLLMNRYANDKDFPQVRRIGMNLGIDPGRAGVQVIVNDLANPEIFGGRLFYRPAHPASRIALGVSAASDINPAADIAPDEEVPLTGTAIEAGPSFLNFAVDIDIPVIENDLFSIIIFGDAGGFIPYLRNSPADSGLSAGWQPQTFYDDNDGKFGFEDFQNYGMASGLFGSILILDYRLEYRNYHGIFEPFYNATYERFRGQKAMEVMDYLLNPDAARFDRRTHGIYGEAHFGIINDAIQLQLGYMWPWNTAADFESDDYVNASLSIEEELLPLGISGGISYTRHGFVQSIANESSTSLFDAKTTLEGEIIYPIAAGMNIALTVGTSAKRNSSGDLVYDADGDLESEFSLGIETRIGY